VSKVLDKLREICRGRSIPYSECANEKQLKMLLAERDAAIQVEVPQDVLSAIHYLYRIDEATGRLVERYIESLLFPCPQTSA